MSDENPKTDEALKGLDQGRREALIRLVRGGAFVAPVVAVFAMQGISIRPAHAQAGSSSNALVEFSDRRLKRNVERVGTHSTGCGIFRFKYLWDDTVYVGVMAQDVLERVPEAVSVGPGNFLMVDYGRLGMAMTRDGAGAA